MKRRGSNAGGGGNGLSVLEIARAAAAEKIQAAQAKHAAEIRDAVRGRSPSPAPAPVAPVRGRSPARINVTTATTISSRAKSRDGFKLDNSTMDLVQNAIASSTPQRSSSIAALKSRSTSRAPDSNTRAAPFVPTTTTTTTTGPSIGAIATGAIEWLFSPRKSAPAQPLGGPKSQISSRSDWNAARHPPRADPTPFTKSGPAGGGTTTTTTNTTTNGRLTKLQGANREERMVGLKTTRSALMKSRLMRMLTLGMSMAFASFAIAQLVDAVAGKAVMCFTSNSLAEPLCISPSLCSADAQTCSTLVCEEDAEGSLYLTYNSHPTILQQGSSGSVGDGDNGNSGEIGGSDEEASSRDIVTTTGDSQCEDQEDDEEESNANAVAVVGKSSNKRSGKKCIPSSAVAKRASNGQSSSRSSGGGGLMSYFAARSTHVPSPVSVSDSCKIKIHVGWGEGAGFRVALFPVQMIRFFLSILQPVASARAGGLVEGGFVLGVMLAALLE